MTDSSFYGDVDFFAVQIPFISKKASFTLFFQADPVSYNRLIRLLIDDHLCDIDPVIDRWFLVQPKMSSSLFTANDNDVANHIFGA